MCLPPSHHRSVKMPQRQSRLRTAEPLRNVLEASETFRRQQKSLCVVSSWAASIYKHPHCTQTGLLPRNINSSVSRPYVQYAVGCGSINICPVASPLALSAANKTLKVHKVLQPKKQTFSELKMWLLVDHSARLPIGWSESVSQILPKASRKWSEPLCPLCHSSFMHNPSESGNAKAITRKWTAHFYFGHVSNLCGQFLGRLKQFKMEFFKMYLQEFRCFRFTGDSAKVN